MSATTGGTRTQIGMARALSYLALHLDEAKFAWPVETHAQVMECVETMYDTVGVIAGDRATKIIGPSDGSETPRRQPKTPNRCDGGPGWGAV